MKQWKTAEGTLETGDGRREMGDGRWEIDERWCCDEELGVGQA